MQEHAHTQINTSRERYISRLTHRYTHTHWIHIHRDTHTICLVFRQTENRCSLFRFKKNQKINDCRVRFVLGIKKIGRIFQI